MSGDIAFLRLFHPSAPSKDQLPINFFNMSTSLATTSAVVLLGKDTCFSQQCKSGGGKLNGVAPMMSQWFAFPFSSGRKHIIRSFAIGWLHLVGDEAKAIRACLKIGDPTNWRVCVGFPLKPPSNMAPSKSRPFEQLQYLCSSYKIQRPSKMSVGFWVLGRLPGVT